MKKRLLDLKSEIEIGQENARKTNELYQLLSSYNAYSILLLKAKQKYEKKEESIKDYYRDCDCYEEQTADLFSLFKSDECLSGKVLGEISHQNRLFLIDDYTLLKIHSFDIMNSHISGLSHLDYKIIKIHDCLAKVYKENVYCGDPYYCDSHYEKKDAFGLFYDGRLIFPAFELDNQFESYNNLDIREILKIQSLDEIHEKIHEAKNKKAKSLILTR